MNQLIAWITLAKIGILLNLFGTLMVAISFGKNLEEAHQISKKGQKIYLASFLHLTMFKIGLLVICIGFILQLF